MRIAERHHSSTTATLECAAQVSAAASDDAQHGSLAIAASNAWDHGTFRRHQRIERICSASSIRPRPINTRPRSRVRVRTAASKGDHADHQQDRRDQPRCRTTATERSGSCRHWRRASRRAREPARVSRRRERGRHQPGGGAALQNRGDDEARQKCAEAVTQRNAQEAPQFEPNARTTPVWTMCSPHSRSAMPPTRFRITVVPIATLGLHRSAAREFSSAGGR